MRTVNNWLITWTACLLRHPRLYIMVPILSVFLLCYSAVYDYTLAPLNGSLLTLFDDCVLGNGAHVYFTNPDVKFFDAEVGFTVTKVSFASANALKYESLRALSEWQKAVSADSTVLSPLSFLPDLSIFDPADETDTRKIEKCFLKILNHDLPTRVVSLFFDNVGKQNHVIYSAHTVNAIVISDKPLVVPETENTLLLISKSSSSAPTAAPDFLSYFSLISGNSSSFNWMFRIVVSVQVLLLAISLLRVYLSICNNHKIRSNVGLIIGWVNSVVVSSFASLALLSKIYSQTWPGMADPINVLVAGFCLLGALILSSRTLFRTVNDLAGDSSFGEPESLHKRLIKFYLGFNSSVENSRGVYHVSSFIRRILHLDSYCYKTPIPNTTIILLINVVCLSATMGVCAVFFRLFLDRSAWLSFRVISLRCLQVTILTLVIDHLLQLTYMVAIIIIDLHRIDLADFLAKAGADEDPDSVSLHEVNPLSARLLASKSDTRSSWRHKLGTYLLKISLHSSRLLWSKIVPFGCLCTCVTIAVQTRLLRKTKSQVIRDLDLLGTRVVVSNGNDALYYVELITVITLIIAISEITFTVAFSQRQKQNLNSVVISDQTDVLSDLCDVDDTRKFEAITLDESRASEKLRLFANPKAPFLVTTDLDHHVSLWSPLSKTEDRVQDISTEFETSRQVSKACEFWPVNHAEISNEGDYVVLINNRNCRIKCYSRQSQKYVWEISLTSELAQPQDKMKPVLCFFRKKTVAGFFARELLQRRKRLSAGKKRDSNSSLSTMHGNFPPPLMYSGLGGKSSNSGEVTREYEELFNREEFVMILETGEIITISCDTVKVKVYNLLAEVFASECLSKLKIVSSKFLTTARVTDRILCTISNDEVVVGSAVNNIWRFSQLKTTNVFTSNSSIAYAPPSMTRGTWVPSDRNFRPMRSQENRALPHKNIVDHQAVARSGTFAPMNESTIVTIDFVGMFVKVKDLKAELIDIQTGTVLRLFHIGSFKPGTFRVSHSEPTHCKFCGCVSFETMSLIYEDLYAKTLIVHTFRLESKKSRNNICLRVERDPLEIRCLGFDAVVESQYWFDDIEMWELTDMNVVVGIKKVAPSEEEVKNMKTPWTGSEMYEEAGLLSLRNRKQTAQSKNTKDKSQSLGDQWQGFVVTASDGKLLDYEIPMKEVYEQKSYCMRPNLIVKFGFKAVAIAFGHVVKIIYLGNDKLIENDLYYSGSASTRNPLLRPGASAAKASNELLFINKRRKMIERKFARTKGPDA